VPDSQGIWADTLVTLGWASDRFPAVPCTIAATNFVTRHWSVLRSAAETLGTALPGGLRVGVARGDTAVKLIGRRPQPLDEFMETFRRFTAPDAWRGPRIPAWIATNGPKLLEFAGGHADGVIVQVGVDEAAIDDCIAHVRRGAERAGRDPADIEIGCSAYFVEPGLDPAKETELVGLKYGAASQRDRRILELIGVPPLARRNTYVDLAHSAAADAGPVLDPAVLREVRARYLIPGEPEGAIAVLDRLRSQGITEVCLMDLALSAVPAVPVRFAEAIAAARTRAAT
jgi:alkanesulfonate monooxygenase SsuD/methylene tetrahydromethanopterin reductase-like flavin-dependent oxidoreductase (luciferase family)